MNFDLDLSPVVGIAHTPLRGDNVDLDEHEYAIGVRLYKEGRILEALEHLRVAATTGKDRPIEHFALGAALGQVGHLREATDEFQRFINMTDEDDKRVEMARSAIARLAQRMTTEPPSPSAESVGTPVRGALSKGLEAYRDQDWDGAIAAFREAREGTGPSAAIDANLGRCYLRKGLYNGAIAAFDRALEQSPNDTSALVGKASALLESGFAQAITLLNDVTASQPDCFDAHYNLGNIHYMRGEVAKATAAWQRAQQIDPDDEQVRRNLRSLRAR